MCVKMVHTNCSGRCSRQDALVRRACTSEGARLSCNFGGMATSAFPLLLSCPQEHGPLLHLHFLATRPSERGLGRGNQLLHHLERMADAGGQHGQYMRD